MTIPFDRVIWDASQCAEYLGQGKSTFLKRTQYSENAVGRYFPKRCPIPGQPRWRATAVTEWALGTNHEQITNEPVGST